MLNRVMRSADWLFESPPLKGVRQWLPKGANYHWPEVTVLAVGIPLFKLALGMEDPFFLQSAFPWLLLPLLLIALRYGTVAALAGFALLLGGAALYWWQIQDTYPDNAQLQRLAGMSIIALLAGELAGQWRQRYHEGQADLDAMRDSMNSVERELQVMQVSHAQLEEELLGVGHSLKRSLDVVKTELSPTLSVEQQTAWLADKMMNVLSAYDWLEVAAFLQVDSDGLVKLRPLAQKGYLKSLQTNDLLLQEALRTRKPVSFKQEAYVAHTGNKLGSPLIAAVPVLDKTGQVRMILAVQHVQFAAYNRKNLNLLATLCSWLGGLLPSYSLAKTNTKLPVALTGAVDEIHTVLSLMMERKRSVALLGVSIPATTKTQPYLEHFTNLIQGSNRLWQVAQGDTIILIVLLPLTNPERFERYQSSLEANFHRHFGVTLVQVGIHVSAHHIHQYRDKQELFGYLRAVQ